MTNEKQRTILVTALLSGLASTSRASRHGEYVRYIVHAHEDAGIETCHREIAMMGGRVYKPLSLINAVVCELPGDRTHLLQTMESAVVVEPDIRVYAQWFFRRRADPQQLGWGIERIRASEVWLLTRGERSKVAVIDTGIDGRHPDLASAVVAGTNTIRMSSFRDDNGHGTLVAGVIAARDNRIGVVGVAPKASLYAAKALDSDGSGNLSDVIEAIEWSLHQEVDIINMSLGAPQHTASFKKAIDAAEKAGVLVVAAAGNDGPGEDTVVYPAAYDTVIAAGATDIGNLVADFSSRGPQVDLVAPGVAIRSTWPRRAYREASGTSLATPFVTGTLALYASLFPDHSTTTLREMLLRSTVKLPGEDSTAQGSGLLDATLGVL